MKTSTQPKRATPWGFPLKTLDYYVGREFIVGYLIALLVVLSLRVILDLFVEFDEFVETQAGGSAPGALAVLGYIVDYYGPKICEYFRDFSGIIILLAAAFSLARMTRQNELTAVLASGISLHRVIAPIVLLSFLLNLLMVVDQEVVLPRLADRLVRRHDEMERLRSLSVWLMPDRNGALLSAHKFEPDSQTLWDVWIILRQNGQATARITASEARWDQENLCWNLVDGSYFSTTARGAADLELSKPVDFYPSDITPEYIWLQRHSNFKSLMSSAELSDLMRRQLKPADRAEAISEKHFRFTDPIINMVMLLLGLPLLVSRERKNTKTAIFLVLLGSGGCFVATFACKVMAGGALNPLLAAWLPIIVFLPLSVLALDTIKT